MLPQPFVSFETYNCSFVSYAYMSKQALDTCMPIKFFRLRTIES